MTLTTIEYNGTHYPARETSFGLIGSVELARAIWDHEKGYPDEEAQRIDDMIPYFASPKELELPESKLLKLFA